MIRLTALFDAHGLSSEAGREVLISNIADDVAERLSRKFDNVDQDLITGLVADLIDYEAMFAIPKVDWSERRSVSELWALRDELKSRRNCSTTSTKQSTLLTTAIARACFFIADASPAPLPHSGDSGITVPTAKLDMIKDIGPVVESVMASCLDDDIFDADLLPRLRERLDRNLILASGGNPADPKGFTRAPNRRQSPTSVTGANWYRTTSWRHALGAPV